MTSCNKDQPGIYIFCMRFTFASEENILSLSAEVAQLCISEKQKTKTEQQKRPNRPTVCLNEGMLQTQHSMSLHPSHICSITHHKLPSLSTAHGVAELVCSISVID